MPSPLIQHYLPMAFACPLVSMCTTAANELYTIVLLSCVLYCTINHKVRSLPVCLFLLHLVKVNLTSMLAQPTEAIFHRIIMIHGHEKSSKFQKHNRLALQITSQHVRWSRSSGAIPCPWMSIPSLKRIRCKINKWHISNWTLQSN